MVEMSPEEYLKALAIKLSDEAVKSGAPRSKEAMDALVDRVISNEKLANPEELKMFLGDTLHQMEGEQTEYENGIKAAGSWGKLGGNGLGVLIGLQYKMAAALPIAKDLSGYIAEKVHGRGVFSDPDTIKKMGEFAEDLTRVPYAAIGYFVGGFVISAIAQGVCELIKGYNPGRKTAIAFTDFIYRGIERRIQKLQ